MALASGLEGHTLPAMVALPCWYDLTLYTHDGRGWSHYDTPGTPGRLTQDHPVHYQPLPLPSLYRPQAY